MGSHSIRKSVQSLVTFLSNTIARCIFPFTTGLMHFQRPRDLRRATANKLTDDALLEIFGFYLKDYDAHDGQYPLRNFDKWHTLVHVCRRWRDLVFGSPRRLSLGLLCKNERPVRAMLDIWPVLPIEVKSFQPRIPEVGWDNIVAALQHPDRVRSIEFHDFPTSVGEPLAAAMQVPFPELKYLGIWSGGTFPALPDLFLGRSTPRLQTLWLRFISFPALPNLLLSANDLVYLELWGIPHSGYISPEAMVACLSSLNRLKSLWLGFQSPRSRPDQPSPLPQTRVVLPALTNLTFEGMIGYSEDFLARIVAPVLSRLSMSSFQDGVFDVPHLTQFIGRAECLGPFKTARVLFHQRFIQLVLDQQRDSLLKVWCDRIDRQIVSMALVCGQLAPFLSLIERVDLVAIYLPFIPQGRDDSMSTQFLELFRPFTAIRNLHVSERLVPLVTPALQELIGPRTTEVLPNLCDLFLVGTKISRTVQETIQPFVDARRLSGQPVAVHHREERREGVR